MCIFGEDQKPTDGKSKTMKAPNKNKQLHKETETHQMLPQGDKKGILKKNEKGKKNKTLKN